MQRVNEAQVKSSLIESLTTRIEQTSHRREISNHSESCPLEAMQLSVQYSNEVGRYWLQTHKIVDSTSSANNGKSSWEWKR